MPTLVLGTPPPELEALLERRRRAGADRLDEVWEGVYHIVPGPSYAHGRVEAQVLTLLRGPAMDARLEITGQFNLGESEHDFRVPDGGLHLPGSGGIWTPTAALVIEIVSPDDESVQKLPFYAEHNVDEVLFVDLADRTATWLALSEHEYRPVTASGLVELEASALAEQIDWP
jgi:hypothetical protein